MRSVSRNEMSRGRYAAEAVTQIIDYVDPKRGPIAVVSLDHITVLERGDDEVRQMACALRDASRACMSVVFGRFRFKRRM